MYELSHKVIDKNGPKPKGTGIKQLRENIAESKLSYEIMDDAAQAFLKGGGETDCRFGLEITIDIAFQTTPQTNSKVTCY